MSGLRTSMLPERKRDRDDFPASRHYTQAEVEQIVAYVASVHTGRDPRKPMSKTHVQDMIKRALSPIPNKPGLQPS